MSGGQEQVADILYPGLGLTLALRFYGPVSSIRTYALVAVASVALLFACSTPSIPIPPPDASSISFDHDDVSGTATFSYAVDPDFGGSLVYVLNRDKGVGVIDTARSDGTVGPTDPFMADIGDRILITFDLGDQLASICVLLAAGTPTVECDL